MRKLVARGGDGIRDIVRRLLGGNEGNQERALIFLDAASLRNPRAASPFQDELGGLLTAPNYMIRDTARMIRERLGLRHLLSTPSPPAPLPAIYQLSLPPGGFGPFMPLAEAPATDAMPDAWDSLDLVRPFDLQLGFIAEEADLPEENVCYRAAQFVRQLASSEQLSAQHERNLRSNLSEIGLRFPFWRPRATHARRATYRVVAELVDAGRLRTGNLRKLEPVLRFYDPFMLLVKPVPRPQEVPPMSMDERSASRNKVWVERVEEALDLAARRTSDRRVVLAEETTFKNLDWGNPTEKRLSAVLPSSEIHRNEDDHEALFHKAVNRLYAEYPNLAMAPATDRPVLRHSAYGYESPGEHWLALNPLIGQQLGWIPTNDGLFGWADDMGRPMVETVWWTDGSLVSTHPLGNHAVGEGWLVLATEEAFKQIIDAYGPSKRILVAERRWTNEAREELSASTVREESL